MRQLPCVERARKVARAAQRDQRLRLLFIPHGIHRKETLWHATTVAHYDGSEHFDPITVAVHQSSQNDAMISTAISRPNANRKRFALRFASSSSRWSPSFRHVCPWFATPA